jgi:hypothetical protein
MRDLIELAIEREGELLDAILEFPELPEPPCFTTRNYRSRIHPQARKFVARGTSGRRFTAQTATPTRYAN